MQERDVQDGTHTAQRCAHVDISLDPEVSLGLVAP